MLSDKELKKQLKPKFRQEYEKYYPVESLRELGFERKQCKCGNYYWSYYGTREHCGEPACNDGYTFIGKKITPKKLTYKGGWDEFEKTFKKFNHTPINRYPVVARWYDDLYFTAASINAFQPYVVSGESDPPANPLIIPQICLRYNDIDNVGVTGRHNTCFIMAGEHVFNKKEKYIYFKDEAIKYIHAFITRGLGLKNEDFTFIEDLWAGGGNFGPSLEYFSNGLELGNQVYMQYKQTPTGFEELKTRVIDMGAGVERFAWFTQGTPTSYDTTFPHVLRNMYLKVGIKPNKKIWNQFGIKSALLNIDEVENIQKEWEKIAQKMGLETEQLIRDVRTMQALYAIADHTRGLLVAIHDGALPSNTSGGHNLRTVLRRCFALNQESNLGLDITDVIDWHKEEFGMWFKELREKNKINDIIEEEKKRYEKTLEKGKWEIKRLLQGNKELKTDKLLELYDSNGIQPEMIKQAAKELEKKVYIPQNFYFLISQRHDKKQEKQEKQDIDIDIEGVEKTQKLYYEQENETTFQAKIIKKINDYVILDKTLFYPNSGGQDCDTGEINSIKTIEIIQKEGIILHKLEKNNLKEGMLIKGKIDAQRRRKLTQTHSATHILYAAAREILCDHVYQAGAEKTTEKGRLDITHYKALTLNEQHEIENKANDIIKCKISIRKYFQNRAEAEKDYGMRLYQGGAVPGKEIRLVVIDGVDAQACGGTHANNTGEVQLIKIINTERIQDGVVRIEFKTGENALEEIHKKERLISELQALWGVQEDRIVETAKRFFTEWKDKEKEINQLKEQLLETQINEQIKTTRTSIIELKTGVNDIGIITDKLQKIKQEMNDKSIIIYTPTSAIGFSNNNQANIKKILQKYYNTIKEKDGIVKGFQPKR